MTVIAGLWRIPCIGGRIGCINKKSQGNDCGSKSNDEWKFGHLQSSTGTN
jgi:hypothetical protein